MEGSAQDEPAVAEGRDLVYRLLMVASISSLANRSALGWLRERDIDLLFCSELHGDGRLARYLGAKIASESARFTSAWVSHSEADGESDLVVVYSDGDQTIIALIENKIAASFQPEQAARYAARSERWRRGADGTSVVTVLLAPEEYMNRPGAEMFDHQLTYEAAEAVLRSEGDRRSAFLADSLSAGIESYRSGYMMVANESVTAMWSACWSMAQALTPRLNLEPPGPKPAGSTWVYFYNAEGFSKQDRSRVIVAYKAGHGQVDLQFKNVSAAELTRRAAGLLEADMSVVQAGKSASIRIAVPKVDFMGAVDVQQSELRQGLETSERLRAFFAQHHDRLLPQ